MVLGRRLVLSLAAGAAAAPLCAPHIARAATGTLRIGHNNSPTSSLQAAALVFQAYVAEKTGGRYKVDIFPSSQLGGDAQLITAVADGTLDMTITATAILGVYDRDFELVELPYLFKDVTTARKALAGGLGAHYSELLQKNSMVAIGWAENGMRHISANRPIRTVADVKGLKIRVQAAKIQIESFQGLGAAAAPLPFNELSEALRTGRFEAQENPISILLANDFMVKAQSHLSLTAHEYSPLGIVFSADVLEDMAPPDRAIIKAAGQLGAQATRDFNDRASVTGLQQLKAAGMTIIADVDRAGFEKAMEGLNDRLARVAGADAIARIRTLVA